GRYISGTSIYGSFVGDGSGLTGVTAGSSDRIVSGTTAVYANNNTGYVSFTSAGNTTGWYSPSGIFAAVGISTTSNQASFTTVYAVGLATLTNGISVTGNITGAGLISTTSGGTVSATNFYGNTATFNTLTANSIGAGNINASGQITATAVGANLISATGLTGTVSGTYGYYRYVSGTSADFSNLTVNGLPVSGGAGDWYSLARIPTVLQNISNTVGSVTVTTVNAANISASAMVEAASVSASTGLFTTLTANSIGVGNINASGQITATAVGANLISATAPTGTVSGTYGYFRYISGTQINGTFTGDGSGLTGVVAAAADRITSGTTAVYANANTGYVSFTSAGNTTGWYSPAGIFAAVGISTTGGISATSLYSEGPANITSWTSINLARAAVAPLEVSGTISATNFVGNGSGLTNVGGSAFNIADGISGSLIYRTASGALTASSTFFISSTTGSMGIGDLPSWLPANSLYIKGGFATAGGGTFGNGAYLGWDDNSAHLDANTGLGYLNFAVGGNDQVRILTNGNMGLGILSPTTKLEVAGAISASNVYVTATTGTVSGTYGYFRYISGTQINGTFIGDGSGLTGVTAAASDRIVSGTTAIYANANTGYVSFTSAGNTTGWYSPGGVFAAVGISTTDTISATGLYSNGNAAVSGTVKMSGSGAEVCGTSTYGTMRFTANGLQLCRQ
ncbi:MAG TPA: hypothetical protein VHP58_07310, partial [Alphaproteobacteria bacterium]|nr:hypothetical protein [Alphaproteobacteria bacterium]